MTIASRVGALVTTVILAFGTAMPAKADLVKELIPTGKLRVAIAIAPAPSAIYAVRDGTTGKFRSGTVGLGAALARKLGVPVEFLPHLASGEIQNSAASGKWDVTFMPVDEERKKVVDFGNAYHLLQSTYLVAPGSKLAKVEDANAPGVRIGGVANTATVRAAQRTPPKATFVTVAGVDAAIAAMNANEIDCIALSRESLSALVTKISGSRMLEDGSLNSSTAVAVPKDKPEALAYVSAFIEEAKANGLVRKALDAMNLQNSQVAPAGMKPRAQRAKREALRFNLFPVLSGVRIDGRCRRFAATHPYRKTSCRHRHSARTLGAVRHHRRSDLRLPRRRRHSGAGARKKARCRGPTHRPQRLRRSAEFGGRHKVGQGVSSGR